MTVPLVDLRAAFAPIEEEVFAEFREILREMNLFLGRNVQAFETEFAAACEAAHGIGLSNGTDALYAALRACGVGPGDEVIAPALTFFATIEAIVHAGATPVLVDVDSDTLTLDVDAVRGALSPRTRAIVPVHLFGHPADCDPLLALAREHGLALVEDAAQAHGARDRGRRCGSLGDAASWSFYFTKNLGAVGEGGFVSCNDPEIAERVRLLRHHGHEVLVFHLIDTVSRGTRGPVSTDAARLAADWCEFLELHARRVYAAEISPGVSEATLLMEKIDSGELLDMMTVRAVGRHGWSGLQPDAVHEGLAVLEAAGRVRRQTIPSREEGGRPRASRDGRDGQLARQRASSWQGPVGLHWQGRQVVQDGLRRHVG